MKLIAERNLLYVYSPLDIHNPHKKKFPLPFSDSGTVVHGQYWGAEEYMIFDLLGDILRKFVYQKSRPKKADVKRYISRFNYHTIETHFKKNKIETNQTTDFSVTFKELRRYYPFLNKYTPMKFFHLVQRASKIRMICNYKYKINNIQSDHSFETGRSMRREQIKKFTFRPESPQAIFDFDYDKRNDSYKIYFRSGLGVLFANNVLAAEWEWLPFEFYDLSKNAQNLYRKFFLAKKKGTQLRLSYLDIANILKIQTPNQTAKRRPIERFLNELTPEYIEYELVDGYRNDFVYLIKKVISN
jgi:hypothetical protein